MQIIKPIPLDDSNVSNNIAENDAPVYSAATTYNVGDQVLYNHRVYECAAANTLNILPTDGTKWLDLKPSNAFALFSYKSGTVSTNTNTIVITINEPTRIEAIALLGIIATSINITATDNGAEVYNKTTSLLDNGVTNWYGYFYDDYNNKNLFLALDITKIGGITIVVTIDKTGGTAQCTHLIAGKVKAIGQTQYNVSGGIIDYSKKQADSFGNYTIVERQSAKRRNLNVNISTPQISAIETIFQDIRATPSLYIGSTLEGYEHLILFGLYKQFNIIMSNAIKSKCSLTIEELI